MSTVPANRGQSRVVVPSAQPMYAAAARWRDEALIADRSLFSGQPINGLAAAKELTRDFIESPDETARDFLSKLRDQLASTSPEAVQVAAELLYVHTLIVVTYAFKSKNKIELVNNVAAIRESGTSPIPEDLKIALMGGVVQPGQAFASFRWKMFSYLIRVFGAIKAVPVADREATLTDWELFQDLLSEIDDQSVWSQRYALEHLLFPDLAPPILSRNDRAVILEKFSGDFQGEDLDLLRLPRILKPNAIYGDRSGVNFYRTPYQERWQGLGEALQRYAEWGLKVAAAVDLEQVERAYKLELLERLAAVFEVAKEQHKLPAAVRHALTGSNLVDYREADRFSKWVEQNAETAAAAFRELKRDPGPESIDRFLAHVPRDALPGVGARLSIASVFAMGLEPTKLPPWRSEVAETTRRLAGGWQPQESSTEGEHYLIFLERLDAIAAVLNSEQTVLRDRLDAQGLAWTVAKCGVEEFGSWADDERAQFQAWRSGKPSSPPAPPPLPPNKPTGGTNQSASLEGLAGELCMSSSEWLEETFALLKDKQQIILQGPPGTGKTFIARAMARYLAEDADRVVTVQFHPGTSYEDFVQGLRPDPANPAQFRVVDGPLMRISREAARRPENLYVLLIDEINRGNVPAVFGELYYLLEYRDEAVTLLYGEPHALPRNLYVIGTMNTADRSITALDSALRRRFFVRDLDPLTDPLQSILRTFLERNAPDLMWLADLLDLANERLNDRDIAIGPSHFMGANINEVRAKRAWDNSVIPTLREYFHSNVSRAAAFDFDTLKSEITPQNVTDTDAD